MRFVRSAVFVGLSLVLLQSVFANSDSEAERKITAFLFGGQTSGDEGAILLYNDVTTAYNTKITLSRNNEFLRSDGVRGMWQFEDGELILRGLDTDGFTIVFDPDSVTTNQIGGVITEGKWKNNQILLKLPTSSDAKDKAQDPIVGKWRWFNETMVQIETDGTFSCNGQLAGKWKLTDEDNRHYTIRWGSGNIEDYAKLSQDGKKLRIRNHDGFKHTAERIKPL